MVLSFGASLEGSEMRPGFAKTGWSGVREILPRCRSHAQANRRPTPYCPLAPLAPLAPLRRM